MIMEDSGDNQAGRQDRGSRFSVQLPVSINDAPGYTRDISTSGMFIVQSREQNIGSRIKFSVDLDTPLGVMKLRCEGEVVRIEENVGNDGEIGLGIKIVQLFGQQLLNDHALSDPVMAY